MTKRYTSRPTPALSVIGAAVGIFMLIFGIAFFSKVEKMPGPAILFAVVWFAGLIGIIGYHIANASRPRGVPTQIIETESEIPESKSATERLRELEDLRANKLISDAEYDTKRQKILNDL